VAKRDGDDAFWSKVQKEELPHCGQCDPATRQIERADGRISRCPRCHPLQDGLLPQTWRCPACRALIYRDQRGLPCDQHRTVTGWRADYDEARSGQEALLPNPTTEAGSQAARTLLAERQAPEPEPEPEPEPAEESEPEDDYPF
jgi:hypothetical protein